MSNFGIHIEDPATHLVAFYKDGVKTGNCYQDHPQGLYTQLTVNALSGADWSIDTVVWKTSPTGTTLLTEDCSDRSDWTNGGGGNGQNWVSAAGKFTSFDSSGFGSSIYRLSPEGARYLEVQNVSVDVFADNSALRIALAVADPDNDPYYDFGNTGGRWGSIKFLTSDTSTHTINGYDECTGEGPPVEPPVILSADHPPFRYQPAIETLRGHFEQIGLGRGK